mgnify:CR=1 FL=1
MPEWSAADRSWMSRALMLAERGLYTTEPNPRVGCVLVVDGEVVGEGWHVRAGEGHAEVNALAQAGERARGATAYVTLEPCSHFGKTPPCADALIKAGVARMVAAMLEDNLDMVVGSRRDEVEAQWKWVDAIRKVWSENDMLPKSYGSGSWGPSSAVALTERDGVTWHE